MGQGPGRVQEPGRVYESGRGRSLGVGGYLGRGMGWSLGWGRNEPGCKRWTGDIDLGGDNMSMEVQEYDTRHGPGRLKGPGRVRFHSRLESPWEGAGVWEGQGPALNGTVAWEET